MKKYAGATSTTYINDLYEKRVAADGSFTHVFHVTSPDGPVADIRYTGTTGKDVSYLHADRLGSTKTESNASAGAGSAWSYDPFGRRS